MVAVEVLLWLDKMPPMATYSLKLVVVLLTMLGVCVVVDVGVVMEGAVEQGSVGGTSVGGATCIIIREQYCLPLPLCSPN